MAIEEPVNIPVSTNAGDAADAADDLAGSLKGAADAADKAKSAVDGITKASKGVGKGAGVKAFATNALSRAKDAATGLAKSIGSGIGGAWQKAKAGAEIAGKIGTGLNQSIELAGKAAAGVNAIAGALVKVGETAIARDQLRATLDQVTKGRGKDAFKALEDLSKGLNISINDAVDQFSKLRKAGASNVDASKLIKLRADIVAVGGSAEDADAAVKKTLDAIKSGKNADAAIKDAAKAFGAVGDGSNAAAKKAYTVEGAFESIKNAAERSLGKLADKLGPSLIKLGTTIENAIDNIDPKKFDDFANGASQAIGLIIPVVEAMATSFSFVISAVTTVKDAVTSAGPAISDAWSTVTESVSSASDSVGEAFGAVGDAVSGAVDSVESAVDSFVQAGRDLVDGFIQGINAGVADVAAAASNLGATAEAGLKGALGIHSPSTVAKDAAQNFSGTFADTQEAEMPDLSKLIPEPIAPANTNVAGTQQRTATAGGVTVYLTINVESGDTAQETADTIAIEVESAIRKAVAA